MREADLQELRDRLATDSIFYGSRLVKIVSKGGDLVALEARPSQLKLEAALEAQRVAGQPQRAVVLKSRKTGISTWMQAKALQRATMRQFHKALTVGHDGTTAGELLGIAEIMYSNLPIDPLLRVKPLIRNRRRNKELVFGNPSRDARDRGDMGLNSSLTVDTAREVEAGRGFTYHTLHLSEVAFWTDVKKMIALQNAVPDEPNTLIVLESTANGDNHFKGDWDAAASGESEYAAVFIGWPEDPDCARPFANRADRHEFELTVGTGPWGEDEPLLVDAGCTLEQLHWRRWAIVNKCGRSLDTFHQEYPSNPEEAFLSTGRTVFDKQLIAGVKKLVERSDPVVPSPDNPGPLRGILTVGDTRKGRSRLGPVDVPATAIWTPREVTGFGAAHPFWRVWEEPIAGEDPKAPSTWEDPVRPRPPGRYVIAVDPMSGEETDDGSLAWHGVQVVNHRTLVQAAEYRSRIDPDLLALQVMLAGLYFNEAIIVVEITGGYGLSVARKLWLDWGYRRCYFRNRTDDKKQSQQDRLGFSTDRTTKPLLEDGARELLRAPSHGIKSRLLASELGTYVKDQRGRTGPDTNKFADLFMSWAIAQHVARERRPPLEKSKKPRTSITRAKISDRGGY